MKSFYNGCRVGIKNDTAVFIEPTNIETPITNESFGYINSVLDIYGCLDTDDRIYIQMLIESVYGTPRNRFGLFSKNR